MPTVAFHWLCWTYRTPNFQAACCRMSLPASISCLVCPIASGVDFLICIYLFLKYWMLSIWKYFFSQSKILEHWFNGTFPVALPCIDIFTSYKDTYIFTFSSGTITNSISDFFTMLMHLWKIKKKSLSLSLALSLSHTHTHTHTLLTFLSGLSCFLLSLSAVFCCNAVFFCLSYVNFILSLSAFPFSASAFLSVS